MRISQYLSILNAATCQLGGEMDSGSILEVLKSALEQMGCWKTIRIGWNEFQSGPELQAVTVPIQAAGQVLGTIYLEGSNPADPLAEDLAFVQALGDITAIALRNAEQFTDLRARTVECQLAEADLREREQKLNRLLDLLPVGGSILDSEWNALIENTDDSIWSVDTHYRLITGNRLYHKNTSAALGRVILPGECVLAPEFPQAALDEWRGYYDRAFQGERFSVEVQTRFGQPVHFVEYRFHPIRSSSGTITGAAILGRDVSARKQLEKQRDTYAERLNLAAGSARIGIWDWDIQENQIIWDEQMYALYGLPGGAFGGAYEAWLNGVHPDDRDASNAISAQAVRGEREYDTEFRVLWPDGSTHWLKANGKVFRAETGAPLRMVGVNYDITGRKQAEDSLRQSEARYRLITENTADVIWVMDPVAEKFTYVSPSVEKLRGYTPEEVMSQPISEALTPESLEMVSASMRTTLPAFIAQGKGTFSFIKEVGQPCKDGSTVQTEVTTTYLFNERGEVQIVGVSRDISERKRAEAEARKSDERFTTVFHSSPVPKAIAAMIQGEILAVNEAFCQLFGYSRAELIQGTTTLFQLWERPEDRDAAFDQLRAKGHVRYLETTIRTRSGELHTILTSLEPITFNGVACVISSVLDITERKTAEQAAQESRAALNAALESMTDAVFISDTQGNFIHFNQAFATFHKFKNKDECAKTFAEYPEFLDVYMGSGELAPVDLWAVPRALRGEIGTNVEYSLRRKDSGEAWEGSYSFAPIRGSGGAIVGSVVVGRDVSERKRMTNELRQSAENFSKAFKTSPAALLITRLSDGCFLEVNEAYSAIVGYERAELIGRRTTDFNIYLDNAQRQIIVNRLRTEGSVHDFETSIRHRSGEIRHVIAAQELITFSGEACILSNLLDITARKNAEEELKQSEERFSSAFHSSPVPQSITTAASGVIIAVNDVYCQLFGYSREEIIGKTTTALRMWERTEDRDAALAQLRLKGHVREREVKIRTRTDEIRTALASFEPIVVDGLPCFISSMLDITERKRAEEELYRSNAELEQFAYVASHDLQEPLRTVAGMAGLLQQRYRDQLDERANEYIHLAVDASERMQIMINDLLEFSRVTRLGQPFDASSAEQAFTMVLQNLQMAVTDSQARITHDPLPMVQADLHQLVQVLQNLIGNAIKFRSERPVEIHVKAEKINDGWCFAVHDNGIGIDPQYFERIFLLFQRLHTRRQYPGTGIGLALCKKIIERHGGQIWIESEPDQGSTFYFTIPERRA
jgi:PAS domain S-box-containing protein